MNISRWLPIEDTATNEFLRNCKKLYPLACNFETQLSVLLTDTDEAWQDLKTITDNMVPIGKLFVRVSHDYRVSVMQNYLCQKWRHYINIHRLSVIYMLYQVISLGITKFLQSPEPLLHILKLTELFDSLLSMANETELQGTAIVGNSCPSLLLPMRKFSLTKILQIIAQKRAEECGRQLVYILININCDPEEDYPSDDNSSMEVCRALTRCITPPQKEDDEQPAVETGQEVDAPQSIMTEISMMENLIGSECRRLTHLFHTMALEFPSRLGQHFTKESKSTGEIRMCSRAKQKCIEYYQEILWGMVGTRIEHLLIWKGIGFHGEKCKEWAAWLNTFVTNENLPSLVKPALQSLLDGLCAHITSVTWDYMFRKAIVAVDVQHSPPVVQNVKNGTYTGQLFTDLFTELVNLSNRCEGSNWTVAALEELPLTEQIPILHRLDHTVHTARLWAEARARKLSNMWNIEQFFRVTQSDVTSMLAALNKRQFANQTDLIGPECSVHVTVCGKMRAKLVSEVLANVEKLQAVPKGSIDVLADVCRTFSLANLKIIFPEPKYWRQQFDEVPQYASNYVEDYLEEILRPVLQAGKDVEGIPPSVACLILDIMCEAWLDHIYNHRIKFSEWGALQLLADFGAVPTWLLERVETAAGSGLLCTEALRRCEGVGRLLLSHPGHRIPMVDKTIRKYQGETEGSPQRMPPEMYVPNQSKWLELRASRQNYFSLCCSSLLNSA